MSAILQSLKRRQRRYYRALADRRFDDPAILGAGNWARVMPSGKTLLANKGNGPAVVDESQMSATLTISTIAKDRHGDIVMPKGCEPYLESYRKNPQVYFNHRSHELPIGLAMKDGVLALQVHEDRITSTCYFHQATLEAVQVFELVKLGVLRAASIGFIPKRGKRLKPPETDEEAPRDQVDWEPWYSLQFDLWELVEWSIVGIPANQDAVGMALGKGLGGKPVCEPLRRALEPYAPQRRLWQGGSVRQDRGGIVAKSWDAIKALLGKAEGEQPAEGQEGQEQGEEGQSQEAVQALLCPKSTYATSDEAVEYVESLGLDSSDVEDAGDFWAFIQFEPEDCTPESARREDMDDGCQVVICTRSQGEEESTPSRVADTSGGGNGDSGASPPDSEKSKSSKASKPGCACGGGKTTMPEDPKEGTEQKPEKILPGKALIRAFKTILDELAPMQENTAVKRGCVKTSKLWSKISKSEYPDEDFGWKAEAEGESEEEDPEEGEDQEPEEGEEEGEKALSSQALAICKELSSWLTELAGEKNLSSSQKAAARHHLSQIGELLGKKGPSTQESPEQEIDLSEAQKLFAKIKEQGERLSQQMYSLTGQ